MIAMQCKPGGVVANSLSLYLWVSLCVSDTYPLTCPARVVLPAGTLLLVFGVHKLPQYDKVDTPLRNKFGTLEYKLCALQVLGLDAIM